MQRYITELRASLVQHRRPSRTVLQRIVHRTVSLLVVHLRRQQRVPRMVWPVRLVSRAVPAVRRRVVRWQPQDCRHRLFERRIVGFWSCVDFCAGCFDVRSVVDNGNPSKLRSSGSTAHRAMLAVTHLLYNYNNYNIINQHNYDADNYEH